MKALIAGKVKRGRQNNIVNTAESTHSLLYINLRNANSYSGARVSYTASQPARRLEALLALQSHDTEDSTPYH
jgi:hypothetical protein